MQENCLTMLLGLQGLALSMLRVRDLSGFVARDLSGCYSHPKGVADETDRTATGDSEDEIQRGL